MESRADGSVETDRDGRSRIALCTFVSGQRLIAGRATQSRGRICFNAQQRRSDLLGDLLNQKFCKTHSGLCV